MNCACHGEPAYWQKDKRLKAGGWWECPVKRRRVARDRYDTNVIYRIEKRLNDDRRRRRQRIEVRRLALANDREG